MSKRLVLAVLLCLLPPATAVAQAPATPSAELEVPAEIERWQAIQRVIIRQATVSVSTHHIPDRDAADVERMRNAVRTVRRDFEADIAAVRAEVAAGGGDPALVDAQQRMLDRFAQLAAYMEGNRLAMIEGRSPLNAGSRLNLLALFRDISLSTAATFESAALYEPPRSFMRVWAGVLVMTERVAALDNTVRIAVLEGRADDVERAIVTANEISAEALAMAEQFAAAEGVAPDFLHKRPLLAEATRQHAETLRTYAAAWRVLTPEQVLTDNDPAPPNLVMELSQIVQTPAAPL